MHENYQNLLLSLNTVQLNLFDNLQHLLLRREHTHLIRQWWIFNSEIL